MSLRRGVQPQGMVRKTRCNQEWGTCNGKDKLDRLKQSITTPAKVNKTRSSLPCVSLCPHCPARAAVCFGARWRGHQPGQAGQCPSSAGWRGSEHRPWQGHHGPRQRPSSHHLSALCRGWQTGLYYFLSSSTMLVLFCRLGHSDDPNQIPSFPSFKIFSSMGSVPHWRWTESALPEDRQQRAACFFCPLWHCIPIPIQRCRSVSASSTIPLCSSRDTARGEKFSPWSLTYKPVSKTHAWKMPWDCAHVCYNSGTCGSILAPSSPLSSNNSQGMDAPDPFICQTRDPHSTHQDWTTK